MSVAKSVAPGWFDASERMDTVMALALITVAKSTVALFSVYPLLALPVVNACPTARLVMLSSVLCAVSPKFPAVIAVVNADAVASRFAVVQVLSLYAL